jgi:alpha-amylase
LADLPDLKQENDFVKNTLLDWISNLIKKYNIDGIRIDTIPEVPKWFWKLFSERAGVYQVGEVFDGRIDYVADYQNYVDAVLNYPLFFALKNAFQYNGSMRQFESTLQNVNKSFKDPSVLGVFVDNHDNSRFLHNNGSYNKFKNALVFSLMTSKK